jgi:hypothetical protein
MLLLTGTSDLLQAVTGAAVTVDVHADWMDLVAGTPTPGRTNTAISTATTTTVVGSPAASVQRNVQALSVRNKHASTACPVTVQHFDGTTTVELIKVTLAAGERLQYEDGSGWTVLDAVGNIRQGYTPATGLWRPVVNVLDYGAKGDGSTDDRAAIQAAINAAGAGGVSARGVDLFFPAGVYAISGTLTCPFNNVLLRGSGWQSTVLLATFTTTDILQLGDGTTHNGCGLMDMSVWCNAARTTGASINVNLMHDCTIRNFVVNNYFQGILVQGASLKVWIENGEINAGHAADGVGIQVTNGAGGDTYVGNIVMSNNPASKPAAGIQITQTGHTRLWGCNITSCVKGLVVNPGASQDVNYLFIDDCLFDSCGTHGAHFAPTNATGRIRSVISVNSWYSGTTTTGAATNGIELGGVASSTCDGLSFVGCRILNNQRHGVSVLATAQNVSFTDCTIAGNGQETVNTYDGVSIAANVNNVSIVNCGICQQGTAANQQRYAINLAAGTSANIQLIGNQCAPNGTVGNLGYINTGALTGRGLIAQANSPQSLSGTGSCTVAASGAINTTETVISAALRFAASTLRPGTVIRFRIAGSCTVSTAAAVPTFRVRMGTAGTTGDGVIMTFALPTSGGVGTSAFDVEIVLVCRTAGASGTFAGSLRAQQASATLGLLSTIAAAMAGTAAAGNTTTVNYLTATYQGASANVTCTFQIVSTEVVIP